ncbi:MAG: MFS transporter [Janthinobacterium lividum]
MPPSETQYQLQEALPSESHSLIRARHATATLFFINGVVLASWASRVPAVQQHLGLSAGHLGLALLGMAVGALPAMSLAAVVMACYNSRIVARAASVLLCLALPLPAFAGSGPGLFAALLILGACSGALNVAQNSQGAAIEAAYQRPIMASFHAFFSVGGLAGALVGAGMASLGVTPRVHLGLVACLLVITAAVAAFRLLPAAATSAPSRTSARRSLRPLVSLALIAFCTVFNEGAMADWSAVYLRKEVGVAAGIAALGYAAFAIAMVSGRSTADKLSHLWGDKALVRGSALIGTAGMSAALLLGGAIPTLVGFACVGLGCACVYPIMVRASARLPHISPDAAIAAIGTAGYMGFFVGPPLIGLAADHITLRGALVLVVAISALIAWLAPAVEPQRDSVVFKPSLEAGLKSE